MDPHTPFQLLSSIAQVLYDKKGKNILVLDVRNSGSMANYLVIVEGAVERHVKALADYLIDHLESVYGLPLHREGEHFADWIVLDYGEMIIHLFIPEMREYYALEKLWKQGKIVDVHIDIASQKEVS